jgi:hypothetical protein
MTFVLAETIDKVLHAAFTPTPQAS